MSARIIQGKFATFSVPVYELPIEDLLKMGKFVLHDERIHNKCSLVEEHITLTRVISCDLIELPQAVGIYEAIELIESHGKRPALFAELISFSIKYPDKQCEFPIIALGTSIVIPEIHYSRYDTFHVAFLDSNWQGERVVELLEREADIDKRYRLLAVFDNLPDRGISAKVIPFPAKRIVRREPHGHL